MVRKRDVMYVCDSCGYDSAKWYGKCPNCGTWNSMREARGVVVPGTSKLSSKQKEASTQKIGDVAVSESARISTGFAEFDRVLGGEEEKQGIVPGEIVLLSGDPGVGKSTILLQVALMLSGGVHNLSQIAGDVRQKLSKSKPNPLSSLRESRHIEKSKSQTGTKSTFNSPATAQASALKNSNDSEVKKVLYITGEESESQVKMRAERIVGKKDLKDFDLHILSTVDTDSAMVAIQKLSPDFVIVDSIQTIASESLSGFAGSVPQIRYATSQLVNLGKRLGIPIFMIGHVTKEGIVAGPQLLSHMVDVVLYLEGEQTSGTRILRAYKNRFGDTSEVGIFLMEERGLVELSNASTFFMDKRDSAVPGSCLAVVMEGSRPILIEVQALCVPSSLAFPRRVSNGIDSRRLELLLAVLQRHLNMRVDKNDIFVNVVGGLSVREVAVDLAVCLAVVSSLRDVPLDLICAISEVGLLGELKSVPAENLRVREAKRFGCKQVITGEKKHFLRDVVGKVM